MSDSIWEPSAGWLPAETAAAEPAAGVEPASSPGPELARLMPGAYVVSDVVAVVTALSVPKFLGHDVLPSGSLLPLLYTSGLWVGVLYVFGLYRSVRGLPTLPAWDEFRRIIAATTVGILVIVTTTVWWRDPLSRKGLAAAWLLALVLELVSRRVWRWVTWVLRRDGRLVLRTLIVGTNGEAAALSRGLQVATSGYLPVGYVSPAQPVDAERPDIVGGVDDLDSLIRRYSIDSIFVASSQANGQTLLRVCRACRQANVELRISANVPQILASRMSVDSVGDVMAISIRPARLTPAQAALKRAFDVVVATGALILSMPIMIAVGIAIWVTSARPILFHQDRVTKDLKTFRLHKFRTMVPDADAVPHVHQFRLDAPFFKLEDDPRVTPVGGFLRRFSLDELPQLWNVIRGEMSLVGPRPLRVEQVTANEEHLGYRHDVKAGLTGWWQIHGRSDVSWTEAVKMDTFYIENWSLVLDIYILLKTVGTMLTQRGAY